MVPIAHLKTASVTFFKVCNGEGRRHLRIHRFTITKQALRAYKPGFLHMLGCLGDGKLALIHMLSRSAVEPAPHLAARLQDVQRVSKQSSDWGRTREKQRRNSSFKRFLMPVRLRLGLDKKKRKHPAATENPDQPKAKVRKRVVRKVQKRTLRNVLPASHVWSSKRMKMERSSWCGISLAERLAHRAVESNIEKALKSCGIHDLSYERWFLIEATSAEGDLMEFLSLFFDPNDTPTTTELSGTKYIMHERDEFPAGPLCPVRFHRASSLSVYLGIHLYCVDQVGRNLNEAAAAMADRIQVKFRDNVLSFLLIGPQADIVIEKAKLLEYDSGNEEEVPPKCPISGREMSAQEFETYFFSADFGQMVTYGSRTLVGVDSKTTLDLKKGQSTMVEMEILDLQLGIKQTLIVPSRLVLVDDEKDIRNAPTFWTRLLRAAGGCCLGIHDIECLYLQCRLPSFPRDYPDTAASSRYWEHRCLQTQDAFLARPRSKRGSLKHGPFRPEWRAISNLAHSNTNALAVARGWSNVSFFFETEAQTSELHPNLLIRVQVTSPKTSKLGVKIKEFICICLPVPEDYHAFVEATKNNDGVWKSPEREAQRQVIGCISSARSGPNGAYGIGHISVTGLLRLLELAESSKWRMRKRSIFVLMQDHSPSAVNDFNWGVAFLSVVA